MKLVSPEYTEKEEMIKVIGLGGGGGNAVNYMAKKYKSSNVYHICANTDSKHLAMLNDVDHRINLGINGLGAGMKIHVGAQATQDSEAEIRNAIGGADMLFLAAGMGGGTGTGAIPIVAEIAKEMGILTVAVVTKPFSTEGLGKMRIANEGIDKLAQQVNSLIILPNDRLVDTLGSQILNDIFKAFEASDDVLANSVNSVTDIINKTGRVNIDFKDIESVMSLPGKAMISSGQAKGNNRATEAVKIALNNPLIEEIKLTNAKGILVNISGSTIGVDERGDIVTIIEEYAHSSADIKYGIVRDTDLGDALKVTVVLTGLELVGKKIEIEPSIIDLNIEVPSHKARHVEPLLANSDVPSNLDKKQIPAYLRNRQKA